MRIEIGDFVLIKHPCFGISIGTDLGPWIVRVKELSVDEFQYIRYLSVGSSSIGSTTYESVVAKIQQRDVEALFKMEVKKD